MLIHNLRYQEQRNWQRFFSAVDPKTQNAPVKLPDPQTHNKCSIQDQKPVSFCWFYRQSLSHIWLCLMFWGWIWSTIRWYICVSEQHTNKNIINIINIIIIIITNIIIITIIITIISSLLFRISPHYKSESFISFQT